MSSRFEIFVLPMSAELNNNVKSQNHPGARSHLPNQHTHIEKL